MLFAAFIIAAISSMMLLYSYRYDELKQEKKNDLLKKITYCKKDVEKEYEKLSEVAENLSGFSNIEQIVQQENIKPVKEKLNLIFDLFAGLLTKIELIQEKKSLEISYKRDGNFRVIEKKGKLVNLEKNEGFVDENLNLFYKRIFASEAANTTWIQFHINFLEIVKKSLSRFSTEKRTWYALVSNKGKLLLFKAFNQDKQNISIKFTNPDKIERFRNSAENGVIEDCILVCEGKNIPVLSVFSSLKLMNSGYFLVFSSSEKFLFRNLNSYNFKMFVTSMVIGVLLIMIFLSYAKILKSKNKQLIESEKKFRGIFESFVDFYYRADMNGTLVMVSPSCYMLSGFREEELIGKNVEELYVNTFDRKFLIKILISIGYVNDYEIELYNKEREKVFVSMTARLVYGKNRKPKGIEGTLRDITERKQSEKVILESKIKAESAVRAKNEFLTNLSHELKTPLNAIIGYAQIYKEDNKLQNKVRKIFNVIENSGNYLLTLLNDLLDISKNDSGKLLIEKNTFNLHELIYGVINIIKFRADAKQLNFTVIHDSKLPLYLYGDAKRIRQILINILGNAAKYTDKGFIKLTLSYKDSTLKFVINDSGKGIPKENLNEIFNPFFQVKYKGIKNDGTGLGLAITKMIVEAMEGNIEVTSTVNRGTTFTVTLAIEEKKINDNNDTGLKKNAISRFISTRRKDSTEHNFPLPDKKSIILLLASIKTRNISEANQHLDKFENNGFVEFASMVRVNLSKFKIDYLVELLNYFLEDKNE